MSETNEKWQGPPPPRPKTSRVKRIAATAVATALVGGIAYATNHGEAKLSPSKRITTTTKGPAPKPTTRSTRTTTTTTHLLPSSTSLAPTSTTESITTSTPTTSTIETTTTVEQPTTTTAVQVENLPNPYKRLEVRGSVEARNYTFAALKLLNDVAPKFAQPINHILNTQDVLIEQLEDGHGRKVYPTRPTATITLDKPQLLAGPLILAAGFVNDFGHIEQVNRFLQASPNINKANVPPDVYNSVTAENEMIYRQANAQSALGDTQANIDHTLSFIGHPERLPG